MPALRLEQLEGHLARELRPLYAIHGDEPLLSLEAADAIRARARAGGFSERTVLAAERGFDWSELAASAASLSLFGERRLIELRVPSGRPGADGARAIEALCARLPPDALTLVMLPRLDRAGQSSSWFQALESKGAVVNVFPVDRARLPEWISMRLARQRQSAKPETLRFVADCVEGNLLAAHQEIQKLALLAPPGELAMETVQGAVSSVARYDPYDAAEALVSGDIARYSRVIEGLRAEGEQPTFVLFVLSSVLFALQEGNPERIFNRTLRRAVEGALRRIAPKRVARAITEAAAIDRAIKGIEVREPWEAFLNLGLNLAGGAKG